MDEPVDEIYEKVMKSGVYEKGREIGIKEGREIARLDYAIKIKQKHGIDETIRFTGLSREEIEKEELRRKNED